MAPSCTNLTKDLSGQNDANWYSYFLPSIDSRLTNDIKTPKVLIFWGTTISQNGTSTIITDERLEVKSKFRFQAESRRLQKLEKELEGKKVTLKLIDLREYKSKQASLGQDNCNAAVNASIDTIIKDFRPTVIVLAFSSEDFARYDWPLDLEKHRHKCKFEDTYIKLDIIKQLHENHIIQEIVDSKPNFMLFKTKNIAPNEVCFLSFITSNCQPGIKLSITHALDEILEIAGKDRETKILVLSGSDGLDSSGASGFTDPRLLDHELYKQSCELVGVDPQRKDDKTLPKPIPQIQSESTRAEALLTNQKYRLLKFLVLNIRHFSGESNLDIFVSQYKPHAVIIDWPFSKDGDVANHLLTSGSIAELRLSLDRKSIVGINHNWIQLDENQRKVLRDVANLIRREKERVDGSQCLTKAQENNMKLRHVVLYGGHGTGKTILGIEVVKMFMAKIRQEQSKTTSKEIPNLFVIDMNYRNKFLKQKSPLLHQLENMLQHEDGCEKKVFWDLNDLKKEIGIEIVDENDNLRCMKEFVAKISIENSAQKSIILIDEVNAGNFLEDSFSSENFPFFKWINFSSFDFGKHDNIYTIACVSPVLIDFKTIKIRSFSEHDQQKSLEQKSLVVRELKASYRNCQQLQIFYNIFKAHFDEKRVYTQVISGIMQQPPSTTSTENEEEIDNLPSGQIPILFKYKKREDKWTEEEIEKMKNKMIEMLVESKEAKSASIICDNGKEDCRLCKQLRNHLQTQNISSNLKSIKSMKNGYILESGFTGCEDDALLLHFPSTASPTSNQIYQFEILSRARQTLLLLMSEKRLNMKDNAFGKMIKEFSKHEEICKNKTCQEHGWSKKKVIEVRKCPFLSSYESDSEETDSNLDGDSESILSDSDHEESSNSNIEGRK